MGQRTGALDLVEDNLRRLEAIMGPYGVPESWDSWTRDLGSQDSGSWDLGSRDSESWDLGSQDLVLGPGGSQGGVPGLGVPAWPGQNLDQNKMGEFVQTSCTCGTDFHNFFYI